MQTEEGRDETGGATVTITAAAATATSLPPPSSTGSRPEHVRGWKVKEVVYKLINCELFLRMIKF